MTGIYSLLVLSAHRSKSRVWQGQLLLRPQTILACLLASADDHPKIPGFPWLLSFPTQPSLFMLRLPSHRNISHWIRVLLVYHCHMLTCKDFFPERSHPEVMSAYSDFICLLLLPSYKNSDFWGNHPPLTSSLFLRFVKSQSSRAQPLQGGNISCA